MHTIEPHETVQYVALLHLSIERFVRMRTRQTARTCPQPRMGTITSLQFCDVNSEGDEFHST